MARETVGYMVIESDPDSSSTPLDEIYASEQLTVYPTITSDFLRISGIDTENGIEVRIYDTYGRMLFNSTVNSNIIDVTSLETGSYIINIDNIKSFSFMKK